MNAFSTSIFTFYLEAQFFFLVFWKKIRRKESDKGTKNMRKWEIENVKFGHVVDEE